MNKTPHAPIHFTDEHPVEPLAALLAWIESNAEIDGARATFEIPVVVVLSELGGVAEAFIGCDPDGASSNHHVGLDDSALGIGIADQLASRLGNQRRCAVWLEANWGGLVPGLSTSDRVLAVRRVGDLIEDPGINAVVRVGTCRGNAHSDVEGSNR